MRPVLGAVVALALVVAACGSAGPETSPTTSTTLPTTTTHDEHTTTTHMDEHEGDHDELEGDTDGVRTVDVVMNEFTFSPAEVKVSAGETVQFQIVNEGAVPHEFRLSNTHRIEEHLASGHEDHGDEAGHHEEGGDLLIEIAAGASGELIVTFPDDTTLYTVIACLLPGHYEAGMEGQLAYE